MKLLLAPDNSGLLKSCVPDRNTQIHQATVNTTQRSPFSGVHPANGGRFRTIEENAYTTTALCKLKMSGHTLNTCNTPTF